MPMSIFPLVSKNTDGKTINSFRFVSIFEAYLCPIIGQLLAGPGDVYT